MHDVTLRPGRRTDAAELARLLTQLGHPTIAADVTARWARWEAEGNSIAVAEAAGGDLAGMITWSTRAVLHRPYPLGRITALVVDQAARGRGLGRRLLAHAESALAAAGCGMIELTSHDRRVDAHRFYLAVGYAKTGVRFARDVPAPGLQGG